MNNKILFYNLVPGTTETAPIIKAKDLLPTWAVKARDDFKSNMATYESTAHIANCPGIYKILNEGFIVPLHYEVQLDWQLDWKKDINKIAWKSNILDIAPDLMSVQANTPEPSRPWSFKNILKFNTAWRVFAPEGLKFLMLPLPYCENFDFDVAPGIWEPEINNAINLQLYWNTTGTSTIPIGTPMCQLIPLSEKKFDVEVRDANENEYKFEEEINKLRESVTPIWKYKRAESIKLYNSYCNES
jgi:hypothetical protein